MEDAGYRANMGTEKDIVECIPNGASPGECPLFSF